MENVVVIGLGLIGGSLALEMKKRYHSFVWGIDANEENLQKALDLQIINEKADFEVIKQAEVVIVAVPVNVLPKVLKKTLDCVGKNTMVFDVGSVKERICKEVSDHPNRSHFVASHPLAGTEFSGPESAIYNLFDEKVNIICEVEKTDWKLLDRALSIFKKLNMRIKMMAPEEHDRHIAYVSHLSHVSSFMLGKTVLEIEKNEQHIFDMASTGFASTVRLAKSEANTWSPIFLENKTNVLRTLEEYIKNLEEFKTLLEQENDEKIREVIKMTNHIKNILE
ncbi:MAG: prephenate dehydrogenase [Flavobacteriaceae bacterium]|nr:prephenate dehydrogenase [Flavobacteriaceae bacterium]